MKYKIVSDSSCDLLSLEKVDFSPVAMKVYTDEKEYVDEKNLDIKVMIEELLNHKGRSYTSCPSINEYVEAFSDADAIFVVTITSGLSGSYNAAENAKKNVEEQNPEKKIHIIDTLSAGPEMALIVEKLEEYISEGLEFEEIVEKITEYMKKTYLLFALQSLHNFVENGRVSKLSAFAAGALGIRVLGIASEKGTLELLEKHKGEKRTLLGFLKEMKQRNYNGGKINIGHCFNEEGALLLKEIILKEFPNANIKVYPMRGLCCYYAEKGGILLGFESE